MPWPIEKVAPAAPIDFTPYSLRATAQVICKVNEEGRVIDATVAEASTPEFGRASVEAARRWRFQPGMRNGRPASYNIRIPFAFNSLYQGDLEAFSKRKIFFELEETAIPAESLSKWPIPQVASWPRYPKKLKGTGITGPAIISFVINRQGEVINPEIVALSRPEFALPALAAVVSQRFAPILNERGQALLVSMLVQYDFNEKDEERKAHPRSPRRKWDYINQHTTQ